MSTVIAPKGVAPGSSTAYAAIAGFVLGLATVCFGLFLMAKGGTPAAMHIALVVVGLIEGATSFYTLRGLRVAWAFALSINGTVALTMLMSAPRIRDAIQEPLEVSVGTALVLALIPCILFSIVLVLLSLSQDEF